MGRLSTAALFLLPTRLNRSWSGEGCASCGCLYEQLGPSLVRLYHELVWRLFQNLCEDSQLVTG